MTWSIEDKDRFRKFLGEFWSTQSFSKAEEKIWVKSLSYYSPHEVKSALEEIYAKKDMRRAMPSLKSVLSILRDKNRYGREKKTPGTYHGRSFREFYEDVLCGKVQISERLLEFLDPDKKDRKAREKNQE